jgi:hypothetical protein
LQALLSCVSIARYCSNPSTSTHGGWPADLGEILECWRINGAHHISPNRMPVEWPVDATNDACRILFDFLLPASPAVAELFRFSLRMIPEHDTHPHHPVHRGTTCHVQASFVCCDRALMSHHHPIEDAFMFALFPRLSQPTRCDVCRSTCQRVQCLERPACRVCVGLRSSGACGRCCSSDPFCSRHVDYAPCQDPWCGRPCPVCNRCVYCVRCRQGDRRVFECARCLTPRAWDRVIVRDRHLPSIFVVQCERGVSVHPTVARVHYTDDRPLLVPEEVVVLHQAYRLVAVVCHRSSGPSEGHYWSWNYDTATMAWLRHSDAYTSADVEGGRTRRDETATRCRLLFYERWTVDSPPVSSLSPLCIPPDDQ